jgi:hypothetical protein
MWEHQCTVITRKGAQCQRKSTVATWCWTFGEGEDREDFDGPTWIETCSHHQVLCSREVARIDVHS